MWSHMHVLMATACPVLSRPVLSCPILSCPAIPQHHGPPDAVAVQTETAVRYVKWHHTRAFNAAACQGRQGFGSEMLDSELAVDRAFTYLFIRFSFFLPAAPVRGMLRQYLQFTGNASEQASKIK